MRATQNNEERAMLRFMQAAACVVVSSVVSAGAIADELFTSFEFDDFSGEFTLGTSPLTATFLGGEAMVIGVPEVYHSGSHAWMISPNTTGVVTFETPPTHLELFYRDQHPDDVTVLTVFDTSGNVLGSFEGISEDWVHVNITTTGGESLPVGMITLEHLGGSGYTVIDDFTISEGVTVGPTGLEDPIPGPIHTSHITVRLEPVTTGLTAPHFGMPIPGHPDHLYILDQTGIVWNLILSTGARSVMHDVSSLIVPLGVFGPGSFDERGLLGTAFHPDYQHNGLVYTYTSQHNDGPADYSTMPLGGIADHQAVITEWSVPDPGNANAAVDPGSAREILRVDQPQFNHNAGALAFGPDGMLYIAFGDGGGADDRDGQDFLGDLITGHGLTGNGQDACNPLGAILRIDPTGHNSTNGSYGIPSDNPFVGDHVNLDEIYAYGFRNPFRMSFDTQTGDLWVADVGQNDIEEINIVEAGGNYGWFAREGSFIFHHNNHEDGFVTQAPNGRSSSMFIDPVAEYDHDEGISVIGGFVYRGSAIHGLGGQYIFGDWSRDFLSNDGRMFSTRSNGRITEFRLAGQGSVGLAVHGFAQDSHGEVYLIGNTTGVPAGETGVVLKLTPARRSEAGDGGDGGASPVTDLNRDGAWDLSDVVIFIELFTAGDLAADMNDDGVLESTDIRTFATLFLAGR